MFNRKERRDRKPEKCVGMISLCSLRSLRLNPFKFSFLFSAFQFLLSCFLLSGCVAGPDYQRPSVATSAAYTGATNEWKIARPQASLPKGNWWQLFADAELNRLETNAAAANPSLQAAAARFAQARASANVARAGLFPHLEAVPSVTRERDSANRPVNGAPAGHGSTYSTFTIPFDLGYEVDLWGRVRRTTEAARAEEQASADDYESARLSLAAEVASDYFAVRALDAEIALLQTNVEVFKRSLTLTRNRRAGGIATDLDVSQAETVLAATEAQIPAAALERLKLQHALAVLTGQDPSGFALASQPQALTGAPIIPPGVPSELLERRPDIAAAERRMAAANARIGLTRAACFPTVRLSAAAGLESVDAGTLFHWPSRMWALGSSLTAPLFEGGSLRATERLAEAASVESAANYRQTVLSAFADVEDNLAAQQLLAVEYTAQSQALQSARKTLEIANNRYTAGLVTYLEVATAQNEELAREQAVVQLRGSQLVTAVSLVKSLGGGWR